MFLLCVVLFVFACIVSALWGYRKAHDLIVLDIRRQSYFAHDGHIYECTASYKGKGLANIDALESIPLFPHSEAPRRNEYAIDPSALNKIKSLPKQLKEDLKQQTVTSTPKPFFNFPPMDYKPCCLACLSKDGYMRDKMYLCPICGNKRCPKAEDHRYKCTNSNAVDQMGELEVFYFGSDMTNDHNT